ncbi:MAG TPA: helix-turn-helix domain-containing protein [Gemmatimonadales bacterium]|nr:helix-turn-helix domain-containing protein [Gemmatimonadales bacterium]
MYYEELAPPPELRGLVHRLWILRGRAAPGGPFQRAMPDGRSELIFNFADWFECLDGGSVRTQPRSLLVGPSRRAMAIRPTGSVDLVGIRFRPEALAGWLRVRGGELADASFTLEELPAPLEATLYEQLAEASSSGCRLAILGSHLARTARHQDRRLSAAVDLILGDGQARPARIAGTVGLSRRQLGRLFQERIGIAPKSLGRLGRFQRALRTLDANPTTSLATVATRAGYFDQAHMSRDFRLFAGTSPAGYRREMRELTRHFLDSP